MIDPQQHKNDKLFDYLFYALAGGVILVVSFALVLWLRY